MSEARPHLTLHEQSASGSVELPEFGTFLRQLRTQSPRGHPRGGGMSRAELATLAERGVSYITKLEQGEAQAPSYALVESLADALGVTDAERLHLHHLSNYRRVAASVSPRPMPTITVANKAYVDNLAPALSGFVDDAWNVLYANPVYSRIYRHIDDPEIGNVLTWFFFVPESRRIMVEWEREAHLTVAWFRGLMVGSHLNGLDCTQLMNTLSRAADFCRMWEAGDVALGRHKEEMLVRDLDRGALLHLRAQVLKWPEPASPLQLYLGVDVGPPQTDSTS